MSNGGQLVSKLRSTTEYHYSMIDKLQSKAETNNLLDSFLAEIITKCFAEKLSSTNGEIKPAKIDDWKILSTENLKPKYNQVFMSTVFPKDTFLMETNRDVPATLSTVE